jgi:hypothetical protein
LLRSIENAMLIRLIFRPREEPLYGKRDGAVERNKLGW